MGPPLGPPLLTSRPPTRKSISASSWIHPSGEANQSFFDARYYDIVPNERIVYAYEMYLDDKRISVSVATFELKADGGRTRLTLTEQGVYLDGFDNGAQREEGTRELLDALGESLKDR